MKIFVRDGARHTKLSGYGALCRNIIVGLVKLGHDIFIDNPKKSIPFQDIEEKNRRILKDLPIPKSDRNSFDVILQIRGAMFLNSPVSGTKNLVYTQHALSRLPRVWIRKLKPMDSIMVPSVYDLEVFKRAGLSNLAVVHQAADGEIFKPLSHSTFNSVKNGYFTFYTASSFGFRKGWDLLLESYYRAFQGNRKVLLRFKTDGSEWIKSNMQNFHICQERIHKKYKIPVNEFPKVEFDTRLLSAKEMNEEYNKVDAFIIMSRGEGWCLPAMEALLCELPVIAPYSTGFKEYLTTENSCPIRTESVRVMEVWEKHYFVGRSWAGNYGIPSKDNRFEGDPDTRMEVPSVEEAIEGIKLLVSKQAEAHKKAKQGRLDVLKNFNWKNTVKDINKVMIGETKND